MATTPFASSTAFAGFSVVSVLEDA